MSYNHDADHHGSELPFPSGYARIAPVRRHYQREVSIPKQVVHVVEERPSSQKSRQCTSLASSKFSTVLTLTIVTFTLLIVYTFSGTSDSNAADSIQLPAVQNFAVDYSNSKTITYTSINSVNGIVESKPVPELRLVSELNNVAPNAEQNRGQQQYVEPVVQVTAKAEAWQPEPATPAPTPAPSTASSIVQSVKEKLQSLTSTTTTTSTSHKSNSNQRSKHILTQSQKSQPHLPIYRNQTLLPYNEETRVLVKGVSNKPVKTNSVVVSVSAPVDSQLPKAALPQLTVMVDTNGRLAYSLDAKVNDKLVNMVKPSLLTLSINNNECLFDVKKSHATLSYTIEDASSYWRPVPAAERSEYAADSKIVKVWCKDEHCQKKCGAKWLTEFRLYNNAVAVRALILPDGSPDSKATTVPVQFHANIRIPPNTGSACTAANFEDPYTHLNCSKMTEPMMTPVTMQLYAMQKDVQTPYPFLSVLQASGESYMGATVTAINTVGSTQAVLLAQHLGEALIKPAVGKVGVIRDKQLNSDSQSQHAVSATSWNVILFAESPGELIEHNYIVPLLCEPPSPKHSDSRWVPTGKSLRVRSHTTEEAKQWIEFAAHRNYQLVHFDAGWYGNEYDKRSVATKVHSDFSAHLNFKDVTAYANTYGIKISAYVNDLALRDTDKLTKLFSQKWKLHGIKFGFVEVDAPADLTLLHERIIAYGDVGMLVNVHDAYRPRGLTRTYPFLVTQEGVRGEERKPTPQHHTYLPFVRLLQGSADYTPRYLTTGIHATHAHQLALPIVLYSPIQSLFWAEPIKAVREAYEKWQPELELWSSLSTVWDDSRVLAGSIGEYISMARRKDHTWFVGTITNEHKRSLTLDLTTLFVHKAHHPVAPTIDDSEGYIVDIYSDGVYKDNQKDMFTTKVAPKRQWWLPSLKVLQQLEAGAKNVKVPKPPQAGLAVLPSGSIQIDLAPSGGNVIRISPFKPQAVEVLIATL